MVPSIILGVVRAVRRAAGDDEIQKMQNKSHFRGAEEEFLKKGIYRIPDSNAVFIDPVLVLNSLYESCSINPALYYTRLHFEEDPAEENSKPRDSTRHRKRKRNSYSLNVKEFLAEERHKEARPFIVDGYEAFVKDANCKTFLVRIKDSCASSPKGGKDDESNVSFIEYGNLFQAPLYEISVGGSDNEGAETGQGTKSTAQLFNNLIENKANFEAKAECLCNSYVLPRKSFFLMSDLSKINLLLPDCSSEGYSIIVVDPPWENKSVLRRSLFLEVYMVFNLSDMKNSFGIYSSEGYSIIVVDPRWENNSVLRQSLYPTLPNRYLLSIPMTRLVHTEGALVALWVTNREKLRAFVDDELFPAWGVKFTASFYWLKVTKHGEMLSKLDSPHHKPYECLILGYIASKEKVADEKLTFKLPPDRQVIISVPGDHSRKPPIGNLLLEYAPRTENPRALELFAREMHPGWTSWGNEPLLFQHSKYFLEKNQEK